MNAEIWDNLDREVCAALCSLARVPEDLANQYWDRIGSAFQKRISAAWEQNEQVR